MYGALALVVAVPFNAAFLQLQVPSATLVAGVLATSLGVMAGLEVLVRLRRRASGGRLPP